MNLGPRVIERTGEERGQRQKRHKEFNVVPTAPWAAPNEDFHHMDGTHMST